MNQRQPRRHRAAAGTPRRQPRVRRASAGLSPIRSAAILAMLLAAGAMYGLAATPAFGFDRLEVRGATLTSEAAIRDRLGVDEGTNLVGLTTDPIEARLRELPPIGAVAVSVELPDVLRVEVTERRAIVIWQIRDRRFAVDASGYLFADVSDNPAPRSRRSR